MCGRPSKSRVVLFYPRRYGVQLFVPVTVCASQRYNTIGFRIPSRIYIVRLLVIRDKPKWYEGDTNHLSIGPREYDSSDLEDY